MSNTSLIELNNAGVFEGGHWRVRGVNLAVERGEIVTLIGPNGSGKSTTAKLALGVLKPTEGSATQAKSLRIAYVPQKLYIDWSLPLDVQHFMHLTGSIPAQDVAQALEAAGVKRLNQSQLSSLSGGEFQRVLIARAMARKPDFLVLDEPVQGVDYNGEIALYELISVIRDKLQCGILMISHDLHVVMAATDRVLCLNGHVCCSGSPTAVAESPEFKSLFGLRGESNLALYTHDHDHKHMPDGQIEHIHPTKKESGHVR